MRGIKPGFDDLVFVSAVGHPKRHMNTPERIQQGPVDDLALGELRVGHDDIDVIVGIDDGAAHVD